VYRLFVLVIIVIFHVFDAVSIKSGEPQRGLRFTFTQVLQTETEKPLTIQMFASSVKAFSWPSRIFEGSLAFFLLWGVVLALIRLTPRPNNQTT
jgi:hypothetical protein